MKKLFFLCVLGFAVNQVLADSWTTVKNRMSFDVSLGTSYSNSNITSSLVGIQSPATLYFIEKPSTNLFTPSFGATLNYHFRPTMSISLGVRYSDLRYSTVLLCLPYSAPNKLDVLGTAVMSPYMDFNHIFFTQHYSVYSIPVSFSNYFKIKHTTLQTSLGAGLAICRPSKQVLSSQTVGGILSYDNIAMQVNAAAPKTCFIPSAELSVKWWLLQNKLGLFASLNSSFLAVKSNTYDYSVNGNMQNTAVNASFKSTVNMRPQFISAGVCYRLKN